MLTRVHWVLEKYESDLMVELRDLGPNLVTTGGIQNLLDAAFGLSGGVLLNSTNARIAVGDKTTAATSSDTKLDAEANPGNSLRKALSSGYPNRSGQTVSLRASFSNSEAVFTWNEYGIAWSGTISDNSLMTRQVDTSLGTKPSNQTWVLTATVALAAA